MKRLKNIISRKLQKMVQRINTNKEFWKKLKSFVTCKGWFAETVPFHKISTPEI